MAVFNAVDLLDFHARASMERSACQRVTAPSIDARALMVDFRMQQQNDRHNRQSTADATWSDSIGTRGRSLGTLTLGNIPVFNTCLTGPVLLGIFMNEVPPTGKSNDAQNRPFEGVEPTEEIALERPRGLPPCGQAARENYDAEFSMKRECPAREPPLPHLNSVRTSCLNCPAFKRLMQQCVDADELVWSSCGFEPSHW